MTPAALSTLTPAERETRLMHAALIALYMACAAAQGLPAEVRVAVERVGKLVEKAGER